MNTRLLFRTSLLFDFIWKARTVAFAPTVSSPSRRQHARTMMKVANTDEHSLVQSMLHRVRAVNHMPEELKKKSTVFQVDGIFLGRVMPSVLTKLLATSTFQMKGDSLTLSPEAGDTCSARTQAVQQVMETLRDQGDITGWRDEMYPISSHFYGDPVFLMERAAVPVLGALEYGVHLNGLVKKESGSEMMWIARRSADKSKYPGMLDHLVAGGQPANLSLMDNVVKECNEEAGVPEDLTRAGIKAGGAISYETHVTENDQISRVVLFCYDLWLPESFQPVPVDGEVDDFFLWEIDQVKKTFDLDYDDPIKPNCYPVIIDYLLRAGHISPETPGYLDLLRELRSGDCK